MADFVKLESGHVVNLDNVTYVHGGQMYFVGGGYKQLTADEIAAFELRAERAAPASQVVTKGTRKGDG